MFAADLLSISIYRRKYVLLSWFIWTKSSGHVITAIGLDIDLIDRHVIIIEDIIDTGKTPAIYSTATTSAAGLLKITALLHKPEATVYPIVIDYLGFTIPDKFVLGYGLILMVRRNILKSISWLNRNEAIFIRLCQIKRIMVLT
jgi:hypoxanthine phosphoribosyltransferase